jgi:hypothetical protein
LEPGTAEAAESLVCGVKTIWVILSTLPAEEVGEVSLVVAGGKASGGELALKPHVGCEFGVGGKGPAHG